MTNNDNDVVMLVTERFERRLSEETGKLRVGMSDGFGALRAEMIERNSELLKWGLIFGVTHIAAMAALLALFR